MIVVANTYMLNIFRKIEIFKLNLGDNVINIKTGVISIKDGFMLKYHNLTGKHVITYGSIGKLIFYQDFTLSNKEFFIFNEESIYVLNYTIDDEKLKPEEYLASIIKEINEKEGIKENKEISKIKPLGPSMNLPKDQYIEEMLKKRQLLDAQYNR